jgi:signal transduction histidine kinase
VGDHPLRETTLPIIGAASEAMVNAAKHSGAERISLYFEAQDTQLEVFVTDQGNGFDEAISPTGQGIRNSIRKRMENAGGTARIESVPGEGTEVALRLGIS